MRRKLAIKKADIAANRLTEYMQELVGKHWDFKTKTSVLNQRKILHTYIVNFKLSPFKYRNCFTREEFSAIMDELRSGILVKVEDAYHYQEELITEMMATGISLPNGRTLFSALQQSKNGQKYVLINGQGRKRYVMPKKVIKIHYD